MEIQPLIRGLCPICNKTIMNPKKTAYINGGFEFFVLFNDNSRASFSCCEECYKNITQEQLDEIMKSQILNWGLEIIQTQTWYSRKAVHLKIIKHGRMKDEL